MRNIILILALCPSLALAQAGLIGGLQSDTYSVGTATLGGDTTGDYVSNVLAGNGIATSGAASGETISHTISVNQDFDFTFTGNVGFTPAGTDDLTITTDVDSKLVLAGLTDVSGDALCISGANVAGTCAAAVFTTSVAAPTLIQSSVNVLPTCDINAVGHTIMYDKGAGASQTISQCVCEQQAGPAYAWGSTTSTGDCT